MAFWVRIPAPALESPLFQEGPSLIRQRVGLFSSKMDQIMEKAKTLNADLKARDQLKRLQKDFHKLYAELQQTQKLTAQRFTLVNNQFRSLVLETEDKLRQLHKISLRQPPGTRPRRTRRTLIC